MRSFIIRQSDGASLRLDNTTIEQFTPSLNVTSHPVEKGTDITDHVQKMPLQITLSGIMTESPYAGPLVGDLGSGVDRVRRTLEFLRASEGQLVDVASARLGVFPDMVIERYPHRITTVRNLPIDISLRQVRLAEVGLVVIPPEQPPPAQQTGFPDGQDAGNQSTTDSADEVDQSIAYSMLQSVGIVE